MSTLTTTTLKSSYPYDETLCSLAGLFNALYI